MEINLHLGRQHRGLIFRRTLVPWNIGLFIMECPYLQPSITHFLTSCLVMMSDSFCLKPILSAFSGPSPNLFIYWEKINKECFLYAGHWARCWDYTGDWDSKCQPLWSLHFTRRDPRVSNNYNDYTITMEMTTLRRCKVLWISLTGGIYPNLESRKRQSWALKMSRHPLPRRYGCVRGSQQPVERTRIVRKPDVWNWNKAWVSGTENKERVIWNLVWWGSLRTWRPLGHLGDLEFYFRSNREP